MAIPEFDEFGLIPTGTFHVTKQEIEDRYCNNPNRLEIWTKFQSFCQKELAPKEWSKIVLVDGGFTSNKQHTKDIDVVLDISDQSDLMVFEAFVWQAQNHDRIAATYLTDFWVFHPNFPRDLSEFFRYIKEEERLLRGAPLGHKKGLLRMKI